MIDLKQVKERAKELDGSMLVWVCVSPDREAWDIIAVTDDLSKLSKTRASRVYIAEVVEAFSRQMKYTLQKMITGESEVEDMMRDAEERYKNLAGEQ